MAGSGEVVRSPRACCSFVVVLNVNVFKGSGDRWMEAASALAGVIVVGSAFALPGQDARDALGNQSASLIGTVVVVTSALLIGRSTPIFLWRRLCSIAYLIRRDVGRVERETNE